MSEPAARVGLAAVPPELGDWLASVRDEVDRDLARRLAPPADPADPASRLILAMRHAVLAGGKRIRPALVLAASEAIGGDRARALPAAAAIELLHAYTLAHDDLPAMDDDDERRGQPTVHVAFGEAMAILAGDALLTLAFGCLAELGAAAAAAVTVLATRAGAGELLAGQARDLAALGDVSALDLAALERIQLGKTAALFAAACELGGIAADAAPDRRAQLAAYGLALGIAFQHADDLDDGELPALAVAAERRIAELTDEALACAAALGPGAGRLAALARWVGGRR